MKCYLIQDTKGIMPPMSPGTRDMRYFQIKLLFTSIRPLSITVAAKLYLCSDTYIS